MPVQKPGRSVQTYGTPLEFLHAVRRRLGIARFEVDLAADRDNAVAAIYYDEAMDSLAQGWNWWGKGIGKNSNEWAWLNPPYDHIERWVRKAMMSTGPIAMLIPASVGSNYWKDYVDGVARVLLLNGRITFVGQTDPYPKDCVLLLYNSPIHEPGYEVWTWNQSPNRNARSTTTPTP